MKEPSDPNTTHFKEWQKARDILKEFDDRLHDLRKYGFTFLTALLTGSTILFESWLTEGPSGQGTPLPDYVKLAILIVTMGLIVTLYMNDRNYRVFQKAAATRATVLERKLNLELTEVIAQRYELHNVHLFVRLIYTAFTIGVFILGLAALSETISIIFLIIAFLTSMASIVLLDVSVVRFQYPYGSIDWTFDSLQLSPGDQLGITLTNLGKETITYDAGTILWKITKEGEEKHVNDKAIFELDEPLVFEPNVSHTYLWEVPREVGVIYQVCRAVFDPETGELRQTIDPITKKPKQHFELLNRKLRVVKRTPN